MLKEIKKYDYRIYPQYTTYQETYFAGMGLWDDKGMIGWISFFNPEYFQNIQPPYINQYGSVEMSFRAGDLPVIIDLLRNEKPVYIFGKETPPTWFMLTTNPEPVGEGERAGP
jgi:hypothetical protein